MSLIQKDKLLSEISTFRVGGPAKYYAKATTKDQLSYLLHFIRKEKIPFTVIGKGSNVLFDDHGYDGMIIHNAISECSIQKNEVYATGGYSFALLGTKTAREGLSGLEFASGVPGSVGGAVYMNAGANGKETCEMLISVTFLHLSGEESHLSQDEMRFSYRFSSFQEMEGIIFSANFQLEQDPQAKKRQIELAMERKKNQPLWEHSAGCIFRNPTHYAAGKLIEEAGLKGYRIGGAMVSDIHANFIVNAAGATSKDILALIRHIQDVVREKNRVFLVPELRYIPHS